MISPSIPQSFDSLKGSLRKGLSNTESRVYWWPYLPSIEEGKPITEYPSIEKTAENLYIMMGLNSDQYSNVSLSEIICRRNNVAATLLVKDIEDIISSVIDRRDVRYLLLSHLFRDNDKYLCHDFASVTRRCCTYRLLLKFYMPKTHAFLDSINALDDKYLHMIFISFFKLLLPMEVIHSIMDSFLLEGVKIIYRYALVLIRMHKYEIKSGRFSSGDQFWDYITSYSLSENTLRSLHHYAFDSDRPPIQKVRRPMKIGRADLKAFHEKMSTSNTGIHEIYVPSHLASTALVSEKIYQTESINTDGSTQDLSIISSILSDKMANKLSSFLSDMVKFTKFELTFSTVSDGYNIETMYTNCTKRSPSIILIKGTSSDEVVGVFINTSISPPSSNIRGDGQTFCFKLNPNGSGDVYRWIGLSKETSISTETAQDAANLQFAVFSSSYFAIGGSFKDGSNAIRVDGALKMCTCGRSDTFGNAPLLNNGLAFEIATVEVLCGKA